MPVIRIDDELYEEIVELVKKKPDKYDYPSVKAFVDKAVYQYLKKVKK